MVKKCDAYDEHIAYIIQDIRPLFDNAINNIELLCYARSEVDVDVMYRQSRFENFEHLYFNNQKVTGSFLSMYIDMLRLNGSEKWNKTLLTIWQNGTYEIEHKFDGGFSLANNGNSSSNDNSCFLMS